MEDNLTPEELIKRYLDGTCTPEQKALVESWHIQDFQKSDEEPSIPEIHEVHEQMRETIVAYSLRKERRLWPRIAAAASIVLLLGAGSYYILRPKEQPQQVAAVQDKIVPGGNRATLTLANGQKIDLNAAKSGKIAAELQAAINKTAEGQLAYQSASNTDAPTQYNTLSTPIGGRYELTLADGTKVLLDAASSITYPVAFNGKERKVKVTGQAYFAVKHDAQHPFSVETNQSTIKDIGTEFNVNTYPDETAEKTTLIEGAVAVNNKTLVPGEQAQVNADKTIIKKADLESVTAWKENRFLFRGQSLRTTMQQIARWYDVKIDYQVDPDQIKVGGRISRQIDLPSVLNMIEGTGLVKFKVKERTITVTK